MAMLGYYRKAVVWHNHNPNLITPFSLIFHSFTSSSSSDSDSQQQQQEQHSFTYTYLIKTCGFPPQTATRLCNRVQLHNSDKPDSVLALFKSHGFSTSETRRIIQSHPHVLTCNAHKTLNPKLTFFLSKGASNSDLIAIVNKNPSILSFGLNTAITPRYNFIKKFTLSDEKTLRTIKGCPSIICLKKSTRNVQILLDNGVPDSKISMLLRYWSSSLVAATPTFRNAVAEVKELGFMPNMAKFLVALRAKLVRKSWWEKKIEWYGKWGLSEETVMAAFMKSPWCMLLSEAKIDAMMEFYVKQLGWDSLFLVKYPTLIAFSLEKRVVPRASVLRFLTSKGLVKDVNWACALIASETSFIRKFVVSFEKEASQLMKLYEEKRDVPR